MVQALDVQHRVIALQEVTRKLVNSTIVHLREVFLAVIVPCASTIIVAYNHLGGELTPSDGDRDMTKQPNAAGLQLDAPIRHHLIIGVNDFLSFAERGCL